jgi:tartrate-resistant acid phosphatase type 5
MFITRFLPILAGLILLSNCGPSVFEDTVDTADDDDPGSATSEPYVFAAIGDYGNGSDEEGEVAELVKSWSPDFVITMGDNNYPDGELETMEENIGQYYCDFIYNPDAPEDLRCNGPAALDKVNRFFPSLGNHDVHEENGAPYLQYFTLPGNERYYTFKRGSVQFFVVDSTPEDEELACCEIEQAQWLKNELAASSATFKIVYFHHAPYSIGGHGSEENMQWPFEDWGAHAILSGHEHNYQRIHKKSNPDFAYIVCGLSGKSDEDCGDEELENEDDFDVICIDDAHGAMKISVSHDKLIFQFFTIENPGAPMDEFVLNKNN